MAAGDARQASIAAQQRYKPRVRGAGGGVFKPSLPGLGKSPGVIKTQITEPKPPRAMGLIDPRVVRMQQHLVDLGYHVKIDGVMGPETRTALSMSQNGTTPNMLHSPAHSQSAAGRHVAQQEAHVTVRQHIVGRKFTPWIDGQKPSGTTGAFRGPDGKIYLPGTRAPAGSVITNVPYYERPHGPAGDPSTDWNAQQLAQANQERIASQGLVGSVFRDTAQSLVPTRSLHKIANGKSPSVSDVGSDVLNGALWLTPGEVAPAMRSARVAAKALSEEGVTRTAVQTMREASHVSTTEALQAMRDARMAKAAKTEAAWVGSPKRAEIKAAIEAAPNISRKQKTALMKTHDIAAKAIAKTLNTTPEHAYELAWRGAKFHDISPTTDQVGAALAQTGSEPEVTNVAQTPEFYHPNPGTLDQAARNIPRSKLRAGAPPHATTPKALRALLEDLTKRATEAADYRKWYANSAAGILAHVNGDTQAADKLAALVAVYSPRAEVYSKSTEWNNLDRAINAYDEHIQTGQISPRWSISSHKTGEGDWQTFRAQQIMDGNFEWNGLKTNRFYRNFLQHIDPEKYKALFGDERFTTIDTWMRRAFGYPATNKTEERTTLFGTERVPVGKKQEPITPQMYAFMDRATKAVADSLGWTPEEAQAAIWTSIKAEAEGTPLSQAGFDFRDAFAHREARRARPLTPEQLSLDTTATSDTPSKTAVQAAIDASRAPDSGFTLTAGLNPDAGHEGYAVSYGAHEFREPAPLTEMGLLNFRNEHLALLRSDPELRVGGWHNPEDGQVYLDISRVFPTLDQALQFGREQGQLSIFDRANMDVIPTGLSSAEADAIKAQLKAQGQLQKSVAKYSDLLDRAHELVTGTTKKTLTEAERKGTEDMLFDWASKNADSPYAKEFLDLQHTASIAHNAPDPELLFQSDPLVQEIADAAGKPIDQQTILHAYRGSDLKGLPKTRASNADAQKIAREYMQGRDYYPPTEYAKVDPERAKRIAEWYDQAVSAPDDPAVRASYDAMARETLDQYNAITKAGYRFEFYPEGIDPYPSGPGAAIDDLRSNRHMYVFPTDAGFGTAPDFEAIKKALHADVIGHSDYIQMAQGAMLKSREEAERQLAQAQKNLRTIKERGRPGDFPDNPNFEETYYRLEIDEAHQYLAGDIKGARETRAMMIAHTDDNVMSGIADAVTSKLQHPLLGDSGVVWGDKPTTHNDIFRAVHDFFGHYKEGVGFRADGEENAWRSHVAMYSDEAKPAMTAETRGQNSWVNYGPHGDANKTADQAATVYADQKAVLAPDWIVREGAGRGSIVKGAVQRTQEGTFLHLFKTADTSTALHELAHVVEPYIPSQDRMVLKAAARLAGATNYDEFVARSMERYFMSGEVPESLRSLKGTFRTLGKAMHDIYGTAHAVPGGEISPEIKRVFDSWFAREAGADPQWAITTLTGVLRQDDSHRNIQTINALASDSTGRWKVERMGNGYTRIDDRETGLVGLFDSETGAHHSGDLRLPSLENWSTAARRRNELSGDHILPQEETPPLPSSVITKEAHALAREHGANPEHIVGTGADGRITVEDVQKYVFEQMKPEDQLRSVMQGLRIARGKQEAGYSEERGVRFGRAEAHYGDQSRPPLERLAAGRGELAGELPKVVIGGRAREMNQDAVDHLVNTVLTHPNLSTGQKTRVGDALAALIYEGKTPTRSELNLMRHVWGRDTVGSLQEIASNWHKGLNFALSAINIPRSIMSSMDVSFGLRQALVAAFYDPKTWVRSWRSQFDYLSKWTGGGEEAYQALVKSIHEKPNYPLYHDMGLAITDLEREMGLREEPFQSNLAEKLVIKGHGPGNVIRGSGRAYTGMSLKIRTELADRLLADARAAGQDIHDEQFLKELGHFINGITGRGDLPGKVLQESAPLLNTLFFSPRLLASRLQMLNPKNYILGNSFVRRQYLRAGLRTFGSLITILGAIKLFVPGAVVGTNWRSADFGKVKVGDTRVDLAGGFNQLFHLTGEIYTGQKMSSTTGQVASLTSNKFGQATRADAFVNFLSGKLAPVPSMVNDWAKNRDPQHLGQPFNWKDEAAGHFQPLIAQDAWQLYHDPTGTGLNGIEAATAGFGVEALGTGLQTYTATNPAKKPTGKLEQAAKAAGFPPPTQDILIAVDHKAHIDTLVRQNAGDPTAQLKATVAYYTQVTGRHDFDGAIAAAAATPSLHATYMRIMRTVLVGPGLSAYEHAIKTATNAEKVAHG
jgi:hypothetical protein